MDHSSGPPNGPSAMGRRQFLKMLGGAAVAAELARIIDPFDFARAAITPGERASVSRMCTGLHR